MFCGCRASKKLRCEAGAYNNFIPGLPPAPVGERGEKRVRQNLMNSDTVNILRAMEGK